jgi:excisionase family DNA binding protein
MRVTDLELINADEDEKPMLQKMEEALSGETLSSPPAHAPLPQLIAPNGEVFEMPMSMVRVLKLAADYMIHGKAFIGLIPYDQSLSIQEAADFLNVPKSFVIELLETGELPFVSFGTLRYVRFGDLLAYKNRTSQARRKALAEMAELSQETGTY